MISSSRPTPDHRPMDATRDPDDMEEVFEVYFTSSTGSSRVVRMEGGLGWRPATDVYETGHEFVVQMDLAGMDRGAIEVHVDDDFLVVRGARNNIAPAGKKHFHKMEIRVGPFERHVRIPGNVDANTARARYESGFLFVVMEKGQGRCGERRNIAIGS